MCTGSAYVEPIAHVPLARLLADMVSVLAEREGVDPASVTIGPVDFGIADEEAITSLPAGELMRLLAEVKAKARAEHAPRCGGVITRG